MNYNDLDMDDITKLLQDFFKNNPSFTDPESDKAKILYDEQKDNPINYTDALRYENPLLVYMGGTSVKISVNFRGVLINNKWVVYCGESTKYYWSITNFDPLIDNWFNRYPQQGSLNFKPFSKINPQRYCFFGAPNMVDITEYFFKPSQKFINWNSQPWGDLK
ncbi:MAG: hypothetical protein ACW98X_07520 [Promethearchaeota archaeon]|jgi:hypothetical protein